jgi:hypothetical protein
VKSLITFPFSISSDVFGGIQLAYQETCRLQNADKIALKIIGEALAAAIKDRLSRNIVPVTRPQEAAISASPIETADAELGQLSSKNGETLSKWKSLLKRHPKHHQ